ncbi:lysocardiolipin acyltransferase 1-like [Sitophilus oryzae]|uniref:Lysocardiolipin acyltransferase 1-like n=1 Tax=Sitophilus oryzae TaxID=7048 RepID=A0A6J2YUL3_SITOR|nr:lysocardiolipin acyltransferase 1-like [Sitophilus oryzae]XP_030767884.1 lysocardiolipin acyltransferase 1-like [Sitophilus oryzae]
MQESKRFWCGVIYFWLWNWSIFGGYFLFFCPTLPLVILSPILYRKWTDLVVTYWQFYITTLLKVIWGCKIRVTGDPIHTNETVVLISNHRTRVDWNFLWPAMWHAVKDEGKIAYGTKYILKEAIKHIPGAGWVMQLSFYLFINRNWERDQNIMKSYVDYVAIHNYKHIMIIFPEGTDLTAKTKESSDRYAEKNGLPKYKHVLHPRTTGFMYLIEEMQKNKCVDAIYDVSLLYPDACPQNEKELFFTGRFPKTVLVHLVRYSVFDLPTTKEGLKNFLEQRWAEKEKTIQEYRSTGRFLHGDVLDSGTAPLSYLFAFFFWLVVPTFSFGLLFFSRTYRYIALVHTALLLGLRFLPSGWQNFDVIAFKLRRVVFRFFWNKKIK